MDDFFSPQDAANDPAADFLAREAAALGADATTFGGSAHAADSFDKDFEHSASAFPDLDDEGLDGFVSPPPAVGGGGRANVFGDQQRGQVSVTGDNEFAAFENEYPEVEVNPAPVQNNGFGSGPVYAQPPSIFPTTPQPVEEESEFIKSWRVKQSEEIARREEESTRKKEETIVKAQNAIDNFYKEYNSKKEKNIARNKEEEATFVAARTDALAKGTTWERICDLVELQDSRSKTTTKSKQDLTRFKDVLLALKREGDNAPGAGGY